MKKTHLYGISLCFLFLFAVTVTAQETTTPPVGERLQLEKAERERPATNGLKVEKKFSGRLPNGFKDVVSSKQRDDIYALQKDYAELIELLKIRIELLEEERDKQIEALLTSEQAQKIKQQQQAKPKRAAKPKTTE
ncbi:MAG: hypothetical protein LBQ50_08260 [Planctomycetaceae bacterium]|jgi:flagellar motility protein MotE (MotC chaperone)|nr:hypothetical protein [Planctomycetaceae bacterium]